MRSSLSAFTVLLAVICIPFINSFGPTLILGQHTQVKITLSRNHKSVIYTATEGELGSEPAAAVFNLGTDADIDVAQKKKRRRSPARRKIYDPEDEAEFYRPFLNTEGEGGKEVGIDSYKSEPMSIVIAGKPRPLRRHRTGKGFVFNPSEKYQKSFSEAAKIALGDNFTPLSCFLECHIIFRMARPRNHFVSGKSKASGTDRLKETSPKLLHSGKTDIDNLIKFVLDSLNGIAFVDDKQVISLSSAMMYDNSVDCLGKIEVALCKIDPNHENLEQQLCKF